MPIEKDGKIMFTLEDLKPLVEENVIVDGTYGGLLLGNGHSDGGIKVIRQYNNEELYEVVAEFEGWEYILNPLATLNQLEYLSKLNTEFVDTQEVFTEYKIPNEIDIIDTRSIEGLKETNKLILLGEWTQFIINKHSTKKYLKELDNINKKIFK